jgi:hypothetical protein
MRRRARVALATAGGVAALLVAIAVLLAQSPLTVAFTNTTSQSEDLMANVSQGVVKVCQREETVPSGITAIRLSLDSTFGPRVRLSIEAGGRRLVGATTGSGWTSREVTFAVRPLKRTVFPATLCASFHTQDELVQLLGTPSSSSMAARVQGAPLSGRVIVEYLEPGTATWASLASTIVHDMGLARAAEGAWYAYVALALMVAALTAALVTIRQELS